MRGAVARLLVCCGALAAAGCGGSAAPPATTTRHAEAHWQDVFDTTPELLVVVRPKALRQDRIYGPLLRRAIEIARERSRVVSATRALDAMEDAEEVVVGVRPDTPDHAGEMVLVERGVRAEVDPGKLVDTDGRALWAPGPAGRVRELVRERDEHGATIAASLFELPGRTWVVVTGDARVRAREAFAHPFDRPAMDLDPGALAIVRIDGASLVSRIPALRDLGRLGAVGRRLGSVTLTLPPGGEGAVRATLAYGDEDAAAFAEVALREAVEAVARSKRERLAWLASAKVERPDKRVVVTAPLPPHLVDALLHAGSASLELDPGASTGEGTKAPPATMPPPAR